MYWPKNKVNERHRLMLEICGRFLHLSDVSLMPTSREKLLRFQRIKTTIHDANQRFKAEPISSSHNNGFPTRNVTAPNTNRTNQGVNPSRSFASIVNGITLSKDNSHIQPIVKKIIELSDLEVVSVDNSLESVLVKVGEVGTMINMHRICISKGFTNVNIHHVRGLWTWIEFKSVDACMAFKTNDSLKRLFAFIKPIDKKKL
ncbi:hypothetical protein Tco_0520862 [Tanacetum coccineum]